MAKVTVIIPCYNAEKYIEKCLGELNKQEYKDFEVICVDDVSSDNTVKVIDNFKNKASFNIRIIKNESNKGPSYSRKIGVEYSKSKYVAFCDSDDWYDEEFLFKMVLQLEKSNSDIAFCGYKIVDDFKVIDKRSFTQDLMILSPKNTLYYGIDSLCMLITKRELILECAWPDLRNGEDVALVALLVSKSSQCVILPDCLYNYYSRMNSSSNSINEKVIDSLESSFKFIQANIANQFLDECEFLGINNLIYGGLISLFTISYDTKRATIILDNFEREYPNWINNYSIKNLPKYKQIVLKLAKMRCFFALRIIAIIRLRRKK